MSKRSSILLAVIAPLALAGCQATADYSEQNQALIANKTPISQFVKGSLFQDCSDDITIDNYQEKFVKGESFIAKHPFMKGHCVPFSFEVQESEQFKKYLIDHAVTEKDALLSFADLDDIYVSQLVMDDGRIAQMVKISTDNDFADKLKGRWKDREEILANFEEFVGLHEIFHLQSISMDASIPGSVKEALSDISAVMVMSTTHEWTIDETIEMAEDVIHARTKDKESHGLWSHFNGDMMNRFIDYLEDLRGRGLTMRVDSFQEAAEKGREVALRMNEVKRNQYRQRAYYWEPS